MSCFAPAPAERKAKRQSNAYGCARKLYNFHWHIDKSVYHRRRGTASLCIPFPCKKRPAPDVSPKLAAVILLSHRNRIILAVSFVSVLRYCPWKYTGYPLRALPRLTHCCLLSMVVPYYISCCVSSCLSPSTCSMCRKAARRKKAEAAREIISAMGKDHQTMLTSPVFASSHAAGTRATS